MPETTKPSKPVYLETTEQLSLQAQYDKEDGKGDTEYPARSFAVEGNDLTGYFGVDPVYQNYANKTEKPEVGQGDRADVLAEEAAREALSPDAAQTVDETRDDVNADDSGDGNPKTEN